VETTSSFDLFFFGVADSLYSVVFPVFVEKIDSKRMEAILVGGELPELASHTSLVAEIDPLKQYRTRLIKGRLHQAIFRQRVMKAYGFRCALTGLPIPKLLDAAHIIPDSEEDSLPHIRNGICMSKLHHTAFDANLIGIAPDRTIHVNRDLSEATDGPLLEGLKSLKGSLITVPGHPSLDPDINFLAERFEIFCKARG